MQHKRLWGVLLAMTALAATLAPAAQASSAGRRNTTLILGGVTAYELLKGNTTAGVIAGAATVGAYEKYRDAVKDDRYDRRYRWRDRDDYRYRSDRDRDDGRYRYDRDDRSYRYDRTDYRYRDNRDDYRNRDGRSRYYLDGRGRDRDRDCR
jgi:hypothetical protein